MNTVIQFFAEPLGYDFIRRGLLSAILLSVSGGLLGSVLVLRRMALMGDALSHSLLPGLALAWFFFGKSPLALLAGALLAGLLTALGSALVSRLTRLKEDAAFGSFFLIAYATGIALVSTAGTRVDLVHFLFGNILGVGREDIVLTACAASMTVLTFAAFRRGIVLELFDPTFARATGLGGGFLHIGFLALTVLNLVAALQTMGVVLALGLFLLPAASAYLWCDRFLWMLVLSISFGAIGSFAGVLLSYQTGVPSGPGIVLCLGFVFLVSAFLSPQHGLVRSLRASWREARTIRHTAD